MSERLDHIAWALVPCLLIAGTVVMALAATKAATEVTHWTFPIALGVGVLAGSFLSGRLSPRKRLAEPVAGALLLTLSWFGAVLLGFTRSSSADIGVVSRPGAITGMVVVVSVLGAHLGRRSGVRWPLGAWLGWLSLSVVVTAGAMLACSVLALLASGGALAARPGFLLLAVALACFLGGLVSQSLAEEQRTGEAAFGSLVVLVVGGSGRGSGGALVAGPIGSLIAYGGSRLARWWQVRSARARILAGTADMPSARVVKDHGVWVP